MKKNLKRIFFKKSTKMPGAWTGRSCDIFTYKNFIFWGLKDLHDKQICHFDIKPQNLLVFGQGKAKLTDFGTCIFYRDEDATVRGASNIIS